MSRGIREILDVDPSAITGRSAFDWIHPDDCERAITSIALARQAPHLRYLPMIFRLRDRFGGYHEFDVLPANHGDDPVIRGIVLSMRSAKDRTQNVEALDALVRDVPLRQVLDILASAVGRVGHIFRPSLVAFDRDARSDGFRHVVHPLPESPEAAMIMRALTAVLPDIWEASNHDRLVSVPLGDLPDETAVYLASLGFAGVRGGLIRVHGEPLGLLAAVDSTLTWVDGLWPAIFADHWGHLLDVATLAFERHYSQKRLVHAATHDSLTMVANRGHFFEQLDLLMQNSSVAVLYMDLDGFKGLNDKFGHLAGDALLAEVAQRVRDCARPTDLLARLGGDEFALAIPNANPAMTFDIGRRIEQALQRSLPPACGVSQIGISVGIAHQQTGQVSAELVRAADDALLAVKRERRAVQVQA